jgi:hypothetical protein
MIEDGDVAAVPGCMPDKTPSDPTQAHDDHVQYRLLSSPLK